MGRNTLVAVMAVMALTTWGATKSFARDNPQTYLAPQALRVTQVFPGSIAARQGIEVGDVIVSVDGAPIRSLTDLQYRLAQSGPVAELGLIDVRTGWQNAVTVYPINGRIGVDVQPTSVWNDRPVRPIQPIYPPWRPGVWPVKPGDGMHIQPVPGPRPMPGR
jgi:membrane-associated protease RseP (regulator of RpoE activity)